MKNSPENDPHEEKMLKEVGASPKNKGTNGSSGPFRNYVEKMKGQQISSVSEEGKIPDTPAP